MSLRPNRGVRATLFALIAAVAAVTFAGDAVVSRLLLPEIREAANYALGRSDKGKMRSIATIHSLLLTEKVTVALDSPDRDGRYREATQAGLEVWEKHIEDSPFVLVDDPRKADVRVRYVDRIEEGHHVQGTINVTRDVSWSRNQPSYKVNALVLVKRSCDEGHLTHDEMAEVVAHELGHLLGLNDHDEPRGLMGPFVPGAARVTPSRDELSALVEMRRALKARLVSLTGN